MKAIFLWLAWTFPSRFRRLGRYGRYLHRWFIFRSKHLRVFVHRFLSSDADPEFHNHPFSWSLSLILSGSYIEERLHKNGSISRTVRRPWRPWFPWRVNIIRKSDFHRVTLVGPEAFTLFIAGSKVKEWGFIDVNTKEYTPSSVFFAKRGIRPTQGQDVIDID